MLEHGICLTAVSNCRRRHRGPDRLGVAPIETTACPQTNGERGQGAEQCRWQRLIATPVKRCTAIGRTTDIEPGLRATGVLWTLARNYTFDISRTSYRCLHSSRATSCRTGAGVPGRPVPCAAPPAHLTLSAAPLASPPADSSHLPYRLRSFIDTGLSLSPKPFRRLERSLPARKPVSRTPSRFQDPLFDGPDLLLGNTLA